MFKLLREFHCIMLIFRLDCNINVRKIWNRNNNWNFFYRLNENENAGTWASADKTMMVTLYDVVKLQSADSNSFPDFLYHRQGFINTSVVGHDGVCYRDQALVIPANATIKVHVTQCQCLESLIPENNIECHIEILLYDCIN